MRYSMLVYITKMGWTLLEAARYLHTAPEDGLNAELLENGRQMLAQIRDVLEGHRNDLCTEVPLERLAEIEVLWDSCGERLEEGLEQFARELPGQVSYQVRAVFFAELGEKWDAMESVYEYMRDDPRFDPVVVRTPVGRVVERNGKREQEVIYEDFLTSMGIPALGYDQYDMERDCPELAFISQPYESCTLEQFWPENIAKYTRLVYLPYYIPGLIGKASIDYQCRFPVYRCAWKVIGMSERHQRFYSRYSANKGGNMLLTGFPKFDAYVRLRAQQCPVPESWQYALAGRRAILWNTRYDYQFSSIPYFEQLLAWFQKNKDCALIWRPHPMTDAVTKLYYPSEIYEKLQDYIALAKREDNIIFDEETSCKAAFSVSTAMISDYSSLIPQYLLLDKPVLWTTSDQEKYEATQQDYFVNWNWMESATNVEDVLAFLERIQNGCDERAELRKSVLLHDIPIADGHCGERVCNTLWECLHAEDRIVQH